MSTTARFEAQMRKPGKRDPNYREGANGFVPPSWNEPKKCQTSQDHLGLMLETITLNLIHPLKAKHIPYFPIFSVSLLAVLHVIG